MSGTMNTKSSEFPVREEEMHKAMHDVYEAIKNVHYLYKKFCDKCLILLKENNELKTTATKNIDIQKSLTTTNLDSDISSESKREICFSEIVEKRQENSVTSLLSPEKDASKLFVRSPILCGSTARKKKSLASSNSFKKVPAVHNLIKDLSSSSSSSSNSIKTSPNLSITTTAGVWNKAKCSTKKKQLRQMKLILQPVKNKSNCTVISKEKNSSMEMASDSKHDSSVEVSPNSKDDLDDVTKIQADDIVEGSPTQKAVSKKLRDKLRRNKKLPKTLKDSDHTRSSSVPSVSNNDESLREESKNKVMKSDSDTSSVHSKRKRSRSNSSLADETFFSPGESFIKKLQHDRQAEQNSSLNDNEQTKLNNLLSPQRTIECRQKVLNPRNILDDFDRLPEKKITIPENARIGKPVRRKEERAKLDGWSCADCKSYYAAMGLTDCELAARMNKCSRHKSLYKENYETPEGFWNPLFSDSGAEDSYYCDFVE